MHVCVCVCVCVCVHVGVFGGVFMCMYMHYVHVVLLGSITYLIFPHEFNIIAIDLGLSLDGLF